MGGINCPPPAGVIADDFKDQYVKYLGSYCEKLFGAVASFYAANAAVEVAVQDGSNLDLAVKGLLESQTLLVEARRTLGTVSSLWSAVKETGVDFSEQQLKLLEASESVESACLELQVLSVSDSLQDSLWRDSGLTKTFVMALNALQQVVSWQASFAQAFTPAKLVAA